jgi:predicted nucleotidyltransferase component of viral defense system
MFYDILDKKRMDILPLFKALKEKFYLAGGTGLALQLGHRDSIDFDFFTEEHFDTFKLYKNILEIFEGKKIVKTLEEKDSLNLVIDDEIKFSILRYPYQLISPAIDEECFRVASIEDIGCMKLSAISSRSVEKDYVDIYFILKKITLGELLSKAQVKMPDLDRNLILKSLVYFDDVISEKIIYKNNSAIQFDDVKDFLKKQVLSI